MKQALLVIDVQPSFPVPVAIVREISRLSALLPSVATVERHDESLTPFERQLGWKPGASDESLVPADRIFIKHGYLPPPAAIHHLRDRRRTGIAGLRHPGGDLRPAAGFALFDAGLHPTLLRWLTVGSSLDPSGELGARLWGHHFSSVLWRADELDLA